MGSGQALFQSERPAWGVVLYTHVELYTWGTRGTRDTPRGGYPGWIPGVGPDTLDTRDTRAARIYPGYPVPRAGGKPRQRLSALDLHTEFVLPPELVEHEAPGTADSPVGQRTAERCAARQLLQDEQQWLCRGPLFL